MMKMNLFNWKQYQALVFLTYSIAFSITGYAQMNNPTHVNVGGSVKEKVSCETSGLECANAANPYFSQDGKLHLVWSANGVVSYAQSIDLGKSWSSSIEIASHGKALDTGSDARPQIVVNKQGLIFIAYSFFRDKNWNAQVNYAYSLDGGKSFTAPKSIVNDASSQRFPSLLLEPDGTLFLSWIDKRLVQAAKAKGGKALGASLAFAKSNDFGKTFSTDKIANEQMCECCRIGATLNTNNQPTLIYRAIFDGGVRDHASQVFNEGGIGKIERVANDGWKTDACPHHGPSIAISGSNTSHVAWFTQGSIRSGLFYSRSEDGNSKFSAPSSIGAKDANVSRPYLMADRENVWLTWKEFDGKQTLIWIQRSMDDGLTWLAPQVIARTKNYSDHPLLIKNNQQIFLSWLTRQDGYQLIPLGNAP